MSPSVPSSASRSSAYSRTVSSIAKRGSPLGGSNAKKQPRIEECRERFELRAAHGLCRTESAAAREHGESCEQVARARVEQLVTPVDRRAHCLLALRHIAAAARQELERPVETLDDLLHAQKVDPRCRELERER